jgi:hypothetical protein
MGDAVDERAGFSSSRACDDEEGPIAVRRRGPLLRIQFRGEIACTLGQNAVSLGIDTEVGHRAGI